MNNFSVTIGYKAVITIDVKADSEDEAKEKALKIMNKQTLTLCRPSNIGIEVEDIAVGGILNMDVTWNII